MLWLWIELGTFYIWAGAVTIFLITLGHLSDHLTSKTDPVTLK